MYFFPPPGNKEIVSALFRLKTSGMHSSLHANTATRRVELAIAQAGHEPQFFAGPSRSSRKGNDPATSDRKPPRRVISPNPAVRWRQKHTFWAQFCTESCRFSRDGLIIILAIRLYFIYIFICAFYTCYYLFRAKSSIYSQYIYMIM